MKTREIKFRCWNLEQEEWVHTFRFGINLEGSILDNNLDKIPNLYWKGKEDNFIIQQFTGLLDKNGLSDNNKTLSCIYEGDIISLEGIIIGNKYENPDLLKRETNLLIEGIGTKNWRTTEERALERGCFFAK